MKNCWPKPKPRTSDEAFHVPKPPSRAAAWPQGYADYASYRPWLRDEFHFRCVFCLVREQWGRVRGTFDLDHFLPVAHHPESRLRYDNLLYCCAACNDAKRDRVLPDPSRVLVAGAAEVREDGMIQTRTPDARRIVRVLGLNDREAREFRLLWIGIVGLAEKHDQELYRRLMGYPHDLPVLARLRPPGGNLRTEGIATSAFALRVAGTLPETY